MEEKELMITVLKIIFQKGTIDEEVFNKSIKMIQEMPVNGTCNKKSAGIPGQDWLYFFNIAYVWLKDALLKSIFQFQGKKII